MESEYNSLNNNSCNVQINNNSTNINNNLEESNISDISIETNNENKLIDELEILSINFFSVTERLKLNNNKLQNSIDQIESISNQLSILENENINLEKSIKKAESSQQLLELYTNNQMKEENQLKSKSKQLECELGELDRKRNENSKYYYDRVKEFDYFIEFYTNPINIKERRNIQKLKVQEESLGYLKDLFIKIDQNETMQKKLDYDYNIYKKKLNDLEEEKKMKSMEIEQYNENIHKLENGDYSNDQELLLLQNIILELKNSFKRSNNNNNNNINNNNNNSLNNSKNTILKPSFPVQRNPINNPSLPQNPLILKPPIRNNNNISINKITANNNSTNKNINLVNNNKKGGFNM